MNLKIIKYGYKIKMKVVKLINTSYYKSFIHKLIEKPPLLVDFLLFIIFTLIQLKMFMFYKLNLKILKNRTRRIYISINKDISFVWVFL